MLATDVTGTSISVLISDTHLTWEESPTEDRQRIHYISSSDGGHDLALGPESGVTPRIPMKDGQGEYN